MTEPTPGAEPLKGMSVAEVCSDRMFRPSSGSPRWDCRICHVTVRDGGTTRPHGEDCPVPALQEALDAERALRRDAEATLKNATDHGLSCQQHALDMEAKRDSAEARVREAEGLLAEVKRPLCVAMCEDDGGDFTHHEGVCQRIDKFLASRSGAKEKE